MAKLSDRSTAVICRNFAVLYPCFYLLYYIVAIVMSSACGNPTFDPRTPFDFNHFGPHEGGRSLAPFLSFIATFFLMPVIYFFVVQNTPMADDYTSTTCLFHTVISCAVMQGLPVFYDVTGQAGFDYAASHGIWMATMLVCGCLSASVKEWVVLNLHDLITNIDTNH